MLGAIIGDIVGSIYEFNNIKSRDFPLFSDKCLFTDDTVMTLAISKAIMECNGDYSDLSFKTQYYMRKLGRLYPNCGYGGRFRNWIFTDTMTAYNSYGNGSAMRVSSCAWAGKSLEEVKMLSRMVTEVTHNHEEGIKGAEAVAVCIFLARNKETKEKIKEYINKNYYCLNFTLDEIRSTYKFNATCKETVPQAIIAFLEANSFEDAIRNAISIGGDSDTLTAITGSIASAYYNIPNEIRKKALTYLDDRLLDILHEFENKYE